MKIHIVQKGDTLWKIAKKYGVNFEELKAMNTQLSNPDMIMPGMKIKVPTAGGTIKKESPISGMPEAKINMGSKKEMPKEQPIALAPKEVPKKEMPIVETPKVEEVQPIAETPKKPFTPKMPKPVIPEIDINNYYMMNMANLSVQPQQPAKQMPLPPKPVKEEVKPKQVAPTEMEVKPAPQLPIQPKQLPAEMTLPKAKPLPDVKPLPEVKSVKGVKPLPDMSTNTHNTIQGGGYEPMFPMYPQNFNPYQQPTQGFGQPTGFAPQAPYPQVQGAQAQPGYGMMPGAQTQPGYGMMPGAQAQPGYGMMPGTQAQPGYGMMPGVPGGMGMPSFDDESSSFMPQMPMMPNQVMGAQDMQLPMMPNQVMGAQDAQMPLMPTEVAGVESAPMHPAPMYPYPPYPAPLYPCGPVMPGPGYFPPGYGMQQMPYHPMPQVQGVMDQMESPNMGNFQMPLTPNQPLEANYPPPMVQGAEDDCGCGPTMGPTPYGMGAGMPPVFSPAYGQTMAQPPYMNPYGYGPSSFGTPRGQNTNDENEE